MRVYIIYAISLAVLLVNPVNAAKVTSVIDGDTIQVDELTIRLSIVDTPQLDVISTGDDAMDFTKKHCLGKDARVDVNDKDPKDKQGRTIALVYCGDDTKSINQLLLENDYAVLYREYNCDPKSNEFYSLDWIKCDSQ